MSENTGFFSKILERRIPQFLGIFLAGSWTALEFTSWAVERYSLSPNWEEVLVVCLLLCLPLILVLAWHHGAPGKQKWTLFEKIFIPAYLLFIPLALHHIYKDVELGKTIEMVMVEDESGNMQAREVARSEYIIPLTIFPLKNISSDSSLDELSLISSAVLQRDLGQNKFYSIHQLSFISTVIKRSQLPPLDLPFTYQISLAKQFASDFFINGTFNKTSDSYEINLKLVSSNTGEQVKEVSATGSDYFAVIDSLTRQINKVFFEKGIRHTDLPIGDLYTSNWEAFTNFSKAQSIELFGDKRPEAEQFYKKAIELDPTFAIASFSYALFELNQTKLVSAKPLINQAVKHGKYRLTEQERLAFNAVYFQLNKQIERAVSTIEQWITLYPTDWVAYANKARIMQALRNYDEYIASMKKVIELNPSQHRVWDAIGDTYSALGKYDLALDAYNKFREANPTDPISEKNLGDLYSQQGMHDSAINHYQNAINLDPAYTSTITNLARSYARTGNFENAEKIYKEAIEQSTTPQQKFASQNSLAQLYWSYGKRIAATDLYLLSHKEFAERQSSSQSLYLEAARAERYYLAGKQEYAEKVIQQGLEDARQNNEDVMLINIQVGQVLLLNVQNKPEEALPLVENIATIARSYLGEGNNVEINHIKGQILFAMGKYQEAKDAFEVASTRFPDSIDYAYWTGKAYYHLGELDLAKEMFAHILKIGPAYPTYNLEMAKIFIAENNVTLAKEYLERALKGWQLADMEFEEIIEAKKLLASI